MVGFFSCSWPRGTNRLRALARGLCGLLFSSAFIIVTEKQQRAWLCAEVLRCILLHQSVCSFAFLQAVNRAVGQVRGAGGAAAACGARL